MTRKPQHRAALASRTGVPCPASALFTLLTCTLLVGRPSPALAQAAQWQDLFNGRDLTGWVNVNTAPDTWSWRDGMLINTGKPIGVMCSEKMYENFLLHIEWMHLEPGGNSGVFAWSDANPRPDDRLPDGVEIQMLELDWPKLHTRERRRRRRSPTSTARCGASAA